MHAAAASVTPAAAQAAGLLPSGAAALVHAAAAARGTLGRHVRAGSAAAPADLVALDLAIALTGDAIAAAGTRGMGVMPPVVRALYEDLCHLHTQLRRRRAGDVTSRGPCLLPA
jgi:hypothetical protein